MRWFDRFSVRFLTVGCALALVAFGAAGCFGPAARLHRALEAEAMPGAQHAGYGRTAGLVGAWQAEVTSVGQETTFPALLTFGSDGTLLVSEPTNPFGSTGHGSWAVTGPGSAAVTYRSLVGSAEGQLAATLKVVGNLDYDPRADTWAGHFLVFRTEAGGDETLTDEGTVHATRIAVDWASMPSEAATEAPAGTPAATLAAPPEMPAAPEETPTESPAETPTAAP